jgi:hypothetical protein
MIRLKYPERNASIPGPLDKEGQKPEEESMRLYLIALVVAVALGTALMAHAEEILPGAKLDETSRDSSYINDATTAGDRAAERAMRDKAASPHVRPEHHVVVRKSRGVITSTDIYVIPDTEDRYRPPLY